MTIFKFINVSSYQIYFYFVQHNAHKLPVAFENLSGLLARRDSRRYNRHRYHRGPPDDHDFHKDNNGFRENCRGFVGGNVRFSNSSIWHEGGIFGTNITVVLLCITLLVNYLI